MLKVSKKSKPVVEISVEAPERHRDYVAETAYYLAEKRDFAPGGELADWYEAERINLCS